MPNMEEKPPSTGTDSQLNNVPQTEDMKTYAVDETEVPCYSPQETKRLVRKIDRKLLPLLCLLYLLSFLDRTNIGNAKLASLESDLHMVGKYDYNVRILAIRPPE